MLDLLAGLLKVSCVNLLLSGDNAVVIALACRNLPENHRKLGMFWGATGAIVARVVLTFCAAWLVHIPAMQLIGSLLLLFIAIKMLVPESDDEDSGVKGHDNIWSAIRTIIIADIVMSLDNVLGVVGAAHGNMSLIIFGLIVSIPIIILCSQLFMNLMQRFPIIVVLGAALIGYVAGEMLVDDKILKNMFGSHLHMAEISSGLIMVAIVITAGMILKYRARARVAIEAEETEPAY